MCRLRRIVCNAQMGIEKSGAWASNFGQPVCFSPGSLSSWRPIFGVGLEMKQVKESRIIGSRISSCRGTPSVSLKTEPGGSFDGLGLLEKEFEFKPSFDEYLKAMESVRTGREMKPVNDSYGKRLTADSRKKGGSRATSFEKDGRNVKMAEFAEAIEKDNNYDQKEPKVKFKSRRHGLVGGELGGIMSKKGVSVIRKRSEGKRDEASEDVNVRAKERRNSDDLEKNTSEFSRKSRFGYKESKSLEMYPVQGEKASYKNEPRKNGKIQRSSRIVYDGSIDGELYMDRAAFKTLEEYDGVYDKPRISQVDMEERIQKLAKCLNGADIDIPEWVFSKMMRSARIRFSDHAMLRIIQILGNLGNWKRVLQVIGWLQSRERFKSHKLRYIYTAALDALRKGGRPVEALNLFKEMLQHMSTYPDLVAYHCIAVILGQAGYMKELFDVIDIMRSTPKKKLKVGVFQGWDPRLEPDLTVYNAILNACVPRKKWEGAFWVLQQMKQQGLQPLSSTYGLVMEVMFACGKYNLVHDFYTKVQKSSVTSVITYKVLVNTFWREGKTDEALLAVQDMEKRGIVGTASVYYDLARCLCSAGRCHEALMQIGKICKVANKPLVVTYTGLIQACLDNGCIQDGEYVFNHMLKFCSPNLVTCNIMLKGFLDHGMFEKAKDLFRNLLNNCNLIRSESDYKNKAIPDSYTFNLMLDAFVSEQRWDDVEFVYKRMLQHGYRFNAKRHLCMILDAARAAKVELLETTWKYLVQANRSPPAILVKERFRMKLEQDDLTAALSCITDFPLDDVLGFSTKSWLKFFSETSHCFRRETLSGLVVEVSMLISRNSSPNLASRNLLTSCREFLKTNMALPETETTEINAILKKCETE